MLSQLSGSFVFKHGDLMRVPASISAAGSAPLAYNIGPSSGPVLPPDGSKSDEKRALSIPPHFFRFETSVLSTQVTNAVLFSQVSISKTPLLLHVVIVIFCIFAIYCMAGVAHFHAKWDTGLFQVLTVAFVVSIATTLLSVVMLVGSFQWNKRPMRVLKETRVVLVLSCCGTLGGILTAALVSSIFGYECSASRLTSAQLGESYELDSNTACYSGKFAVIFLWIASVSWTALLVLACRESRARRVRHIRAEEVEVVLSSTLSPDDGRSMDSTSTTPPEMQTKITTLIPSHSLRSLKKCIIAHHSQPQMEYSLPDLPWGPGTGSPPPRYSSTEVFH